jgi:hypothetical protein
MNRIKLGFLYVLATLIAAGCGMPLIEYTEEIKGGPAEENPSSPVGPSVPGGGNGVPLITNYDLQAYVPVPTAGAAPVKAVLGRQDLEVSVVWRDSNGNDITGDLTAFEEGAVYQADITLKTKGDYAFDPAASFKYYPANAVTAQPDDNTDAANRSLSTVTYNPTAAPKLIAASINLTKQVPKPVKGATPAASFSEPTYSGTVAWYKTVGNTALSGLFQGGTEYTALVTLTPAPGYVFPDKVTVEHDDQGTPGDFEPGTEPGKVLGSILFGGTEADILIDNVNLAYLIPAPATGGTPVTYFLTPQYSGTVSWRPKDSVFKPGTIYEAAVTFDPAAGYGFSPTATANHGGKSYPITSEYDLSLYVSVPVVDGSTPKTGPYTIFTGGMEVSVSVKWFKRDNTWYTDGDWEEFNNPFVVGDKYGAEITLTAQSGAFDEASTFKYPDYPTDNGKYPPDINFIFGDKGPIRGYYRGTQAGDKGSEKPDAPTPETDDDIAYGDRPDNWVWQGFSNDGDDTNDDPMVLDDTSPNKARTEERFIRVGFNETQTAPPSAANTYGLTGVIKFNPTDIPLYNYYYNATIKDVKDLLQVAHDKGMNFLELRLDKRHEGTDKGGDPDKEFDLSKRYRFTMSTANSPVNVVIDGGGRELAVFLTVGNDITLTLRNMTLLGVVPNNPNSDEVVVESTGHLILEDGVVIGNHSIVSNGGGVMVNGKLTMRGGTISGNTTAANGGGVYVGATGTFTMQGGTVSGNTAAANGGGVYVENGGTFIKTGGTIYGGTESNKLDGTVRKNTATSSGHAVYYAADSGYSSDNTLNTIDGISTAKLPASGTGDNWTKQ